MPVFNPAHQFLNQSKSEVGTYALDIADLAANDIPLPLTFCVPVSTLKLIAQHNDLEKKFKQICTDLKNQKFKAKQALQKVHRLILRQSYPDLVTDKILTYYSEQFNKDFIRLTASPVQGFKTEYKREDNIQGEANLMESILKLWAKNLDLYYLKQEVLFPIAIIVQSQAQPSSSGLAFSINPNNGDKSKILIKAVFGVYNLKQSAAIHDTFLIDQRDWRIIDQKVVPKPHALVRQLDYLEVQNLSAEYNQRASLSTKQIKELAKLVKKLKLDQLNQIKVHWNIINQRLVITKIKPFYGNDRSSRKKSETYRTIVLGQGITTGFIPGKARIISQKKDLNSFNPGEIAIVSQLDTTLTSLIYNASAIVCEKGIASDELLTKIRHYQLPAIINARQAKTTIHTGQSIVVDASAGKVYQAPIATNEFKALNRKTTPAVFLAVNDLSEVDENLALMSDGIGLFRSEHQFIKTGQHPLLTIRQNSDKFQQKLVNDFINFYHRFINLKGKSPLIIYRTLNLDSNQLKKLSGGLNFEKTENNPLLGYRGALRQLRQPQVLTFELNLLKKISRKLDRQLNLLLPYVRTSFELQQLLLFIDRQFETEVEQPRLWLQLTTPENLLNIKDYLKVPLAGISINVRVIHSLLTGIDPSNSEVYQQYTLNHALLKKLITDAVEVIKKQESDLKILLNLAEFDQELVELAQYLKIDGITIRPDYVQQTKKFIINQATPL